MCALAFDITRLSGCNLRVNSEEVIFALRVHKGTASAGNFIRNNDLSISRSTLNNWLSGTCLMPFDIAVALLGAKKIKEISPIRLASGKSSSHISATVPRFFDVRLAYVIGAIIGDGSLRHQDRGSYLISFEMTDLEILTSIQKNFEAIFKLHKTIKRVRRSNGKESWLLRYSNKVVYCFLREFFNLYPRKTKTVSIPYFEVMTRKEKLALLLGLYHTDGSYSNGNFRFYTSSKKLQEDITSIVQSLGYKVGLYTYSRLLYSPEYQLRVSSSSAFFRELRGIETEMQSI